MYKALTNNEEQITWYDPGVATDTSSTAAAVRRSRLLLEALGARFGGWIMATLGRVARVVEGATGSGITENVAQAYAEIVRHYRPGDRIYLTGFSRGAYTVRCVAGVIHRCGLLRAEYLRYADDLVHLYRTREHPSDPVLVPEWMKHDPATVRVEFLGVFDTVGSLGVPLWGWWFRALPHWKNKALSTDPMPVCHHIYHAMAMDERRSQFFPTPFARPKTGGTTLEQVWFRGAHADIGGGYAETGLSDIALAWMVAAAKRHGLTFGDEIAKDRRPDPLARLHDELTRKPAWRRFGSWPRWHPVPGAENPAAPAPPGTLHPSVLRRMKVAHDRLGRPDFVRLDVGQSFDIDVQASREWDRTGIVLGPGYYRLTHLGGEWRNAEDRPCGPAGERARDVPIPRRWFGASRRLPNEDWTRLCAAVAHPREWGLHEYGMGKLVRHLFWKDPKRLRCQVAPIGRDMGQQGASVYLHSRAEPGLLYVFANDLWHTAANNSGGLRLRVEKVEQPPGGQVIWTLHDLGHWTSGRTAFAPFVPVSAGCGQAVDA